MLHDWTLSDEGQAEEIAEYWEIALQHSRLLSGLVFAVYVKVGNHCNHNDQWGILDKIRCWHEDEDASYPDQTPLQWCREYNDKSKDWRDNMLHAYRDGKEIPLF